MVKKVCAKNNRSITEDTIEDMVEEVYNNVEVNNGIDLNITVNNEVRKDGKTENIADITENRAPKRNNTLRDLVKILILRELIGNQSCYGPGCRPGNINPPPRPPFGLRPPFPRYDF